MQLVYFGYSMEREWFNAAHLVLALHSFIDCVSKQHTKAKLLSNLAF